MDVKITPSTDGPLVVEGNIQIVTADGTVLPSKGEKTYLCRCGQSSHKPFCDGSHKKAGFKAD